MVFATVAVELLPDLTRTHAISEVVLGFALGVALMLLIRRFAAEPASVAANASSHPTLPVGMLVAVGVDLLLDGLLLGLAFAVGAKEGYVLTGALAAELLSLGLAIGATLAAFPRSRVAVVAVFEAATVILGAAIGVTAVSQFSEGALATVLALGCAALPFLVTEELLVEAHESGESTFATTMFFVGFRCSW